MSQASASAPDEDENDVLTGPLIPDSLSQAIPTSAGARAKCCVAALEEELEAMRQERGRKQSRMVILFTNGLEDLIAKNDRRCEDESRDNTLAAGYIELTRVLPWLHKKLHALDSDDSNDMVKKLRKGADAARGDDTSTLKDLVATWLNQDFGPSPLIKPNTKHSCGFMNDVCGKLLCPAEWDWNENRMKSGIHDRRSDYIVSENSWPLFLYENYIVDHGSLEKGLFKSKLLVQGFKAIFTSPSSARAADEDGDRADILENNKRARQAIRSSEGLVRSIKCFLLAARLMVTSTMKCFGIISVDFFENAPGPVARQKVFGTNHRQDLTSDVVSKMSVSTLAEQRNTLEDAAFNSD
ncbi:uncharacterized protein EDB91DRAFT_1258086 [Suillus paluster]|uniref:uncharacterized protein n=1 Tax=Suillus paluster TaxID=48578 RepID=UPI001B87E8C3|nr:uncharacterized protein EDB91DRAFT_1258086 [Suillus paluster]KAG1718903.1 hypothetical protein EDB91DRAFT_1258086 [Suillus paluster]